ncbi:MAG TPA: alpha-amylase family glycosyl hydrolase [Jatrophihabitantaceae bacterium]|jgi:maltose alpha-D-glucosyltransferase/alpha-amylase
MTERWYKNAVIYSVEVDSFQDSDGDRAGDLPGLTSRLDHLARLGITCQWLNPIHPSPQRDNGYDVSDYYRVDPRLGTLGDFTQLAIQARERGIRILLDLVVNHTSEPTSVVPVRSFGDADYEPLGKHRGDVKLSGFGYC